MEADFLSSDMGKPELVIRNMNAWGSCLELFLGTYDASEIGAVMMEICKFCVPRNYHPGVSYIMSEFY